MIKEYVNQSYFVDRMTQTYDNSNFTYNGKVALFNYLEQLSDDIGEDIELDTIALCCEYSEYQTAWEAMEQYQPENIPTVDIVDENDNGKNLVEIAEESEKLALEWLQERTQVIEFDSGIIIQNF